MQSKKVSRNRVGRTGQVPCHSEPSTSLSLPVRTAQLMPPHFCWLIVLAAGLGVLCHNPSKPPAQGTTQGQGRGGTYLLPHVFHSGLFSAAVVSSQLISLFVQTQAPVNI